MDIGPEDPHWQEAISCSQHGKAFTHSSQVTHPPVPQQREARCVFAVRPFLQPELQPHSAPAGPPQGGAVCLPGVRGAFSISAFLSEHPHRGKAL